MNIIIMLCALSTMFLVGMEQQVKKRSDIQFDSELRDIPLNDSPVEINIDGEELDKNHENLHIEFLKQLPLFASRKSDENTIKETMDWLGKHNEQGYILIQRALIKEESARTVTIDPEKINSVNQQLLYEILLANKHAFEVAEQHRKDDLWLGTKRWVAGIVLGVPSLALSIYNLAKAFQG